MVVLGFHIWGRSFPSLIYLSLFSSLSLPLSLLFPPMHKCSKNHKNTHLLNVLGRLNSCNRKSDWCVDAPSTGSCITRDTSGTIISLPANFPLSHPYQLLQNIIRQCKPSKFSFCYYSNHRNTNLTDVQCVGLRDNTTQALVTLHAS